MLIMFKSYIFDFDGTLCDSRINIVNSLNYALKSRLMGTIEAERIVPLIGKMNIEDTFRHFSPALDDDMIALLTATFRKYQRNHIEDELTIYPHVESTLSKLRSAGKKLSILTTKNTQQIKHIIIIKKLDQYFDFVMGEALYPGSPKKPDKRCLNDIIMATGCDSDHVMIGDSAVDCEFAKNCNIPMIGVSYGVDSAQTLIDCGAMNVVGAIDQIL